MTIRKLLLALGSTLAAACGGTPPDTLGPTAAGALAPCPESPNCVHTGDRHPAGTEPILLDREMPEAELVAALRDVLEAMPRTRVVTVDGGYLHAEARSLVFRFVDDVEFLVEDDRELVVRSASRVGEGDLGVNGRRVADIRERLAERGLLR